MQFRSPDAVRLPCAVPDHADRARHGWCFWPGCARRRRGGGPAIPGSCGRPNAASVKTGDIGNRLYLRHGRQPRAEGVVEGLQGFLLQVDISEIVLHEGDEPDVVFAVSSPALAAEGSAALAPPRPLRAVSRWPLGFALRPALTALARCSLEAGRDEGMAAFLAEQRNGLVRPPGLLVYPEPPCYSDGQTEVPPSASWNRRVYFIGPHASIFARLYACLRRVSCRQSSGPSVKVQTVTVPAPVFALRAVPAYR
jgi:hypothetical protein